MVVNALAYLVPATIIAFTDDARSWFLEDWHWVWVIVGIVILLLVLSSYRQFAQLHPILDLRIEAQQPADHSYVDCLGARYRVITLPQVGVNTYNTARCQLEFELVGSFGHLGTQPFGRIQSLEPRYANFMTNPKVFEDKPGVYRRDLAFADLQDKLGINPPLDGMRLRFRDVTQRDTEWREFALPGTYDTRR